MANQEDLTLESHVIVNRSASAIYSAWRNFENIPQVLDFVENVMLLDEGRSRWTARIANGERVIWDTEIVTDEKGKRIEWRSLGNADVLQEGSVRFSPGPLSGTLVRLELRFYFPLSEDSRPEMIGPDLENRITTGMERFKQSMEADEFPRPRDNRSSLPEGYLPIDNRRNHFPD